MPATAIATITGQLGEDRSIVGLATATPVGAMASSARWLWRGDFPSSGVQGHRAASGHWRSAALKSSLVPPLERVEPKRARAEVVAPSRVGGAAPACANSCSLFCADDCGS